ncbi:MAG TPA: hypothetical protein VFI93_07170 [Rhizomicrobium sp.]|jgi:hypothetical protein|nr:hypothetical protein [Rhizomicrobium sp.]
MMARLIIVFALALSVAACGVKNNLIKPNGQQTTKGDKDPSQPPQSIGR